MTLDLVKRNGLLLLGCGKMGSALLKGWLQGGLPPSSVWVREPHPSDWLRGSGVRLNEVPPDRPAALLVAVKPQVMAEALPAVHGFGGGQTLILSIAAGTRIASFEAAFGPDAPIVRAMPNIPAAVGRGVTAICGNARAKAADLALAEALLKAVGLVVRLEGEHQMDAVTAVSGSGPGYVFHFVEALAAAGAAEGLPPDLAMQLARATVSGAGEMLHLSPDSAAALRESVTSQKGTTAAGLDVLMPELTPLVTLAVRAAADRGRELGQ